MACDKKLIILHDKIPKETFEKYGILVSTIGHVEWFLRECLIFIILNSKFDENNTIHNVLAEYISRLNFDKKVSLVEDFKLLSPSLAAKMEVIRLRRNIFIHGIILQHPDEPPSIELRKSNGKIEKEIFDLDNISSFLDNVESAGGELICEFEAKGFNLPKL